jgi:hypothetical protein
MQGINFGMAFTGTHMPAFGDDLAVFDDDTTYPGIGISGVQSSFSQLYGSGHKMFRCRHSKLFLNG